MGVIPTRMFPLGVGRGAPYTQIYGIRSDGVSYCALPGNVNASSGRFDLLFDLTTTSYTGQGHVLGSHGSGLGSHFLWHLNQSNSVGIYCFGYVFAGSNPSFGASGQTIDSCKNSSGNFVKINNVSRGRYDSAATQNTGRFLIFRANKNETSVSPATGTSVSIVVIRSLKVWFGDALVADLLPAKENATGEVCFYNSVDSNFIKNIAGNGSSLIEVTA